MTSEAWIALIGILGTLFGTLGSAYLTNRWAAKREERQWARQKQDEYRRDLRDACENFAALAMMLAAGELRDSETLIRGYGRVEVLSSGAISEQAHNLYKVCNEANKKWQQAKSDKERNEALAAVVPAYEAFLAQVQTELQEDTST